MKIRRTIWIEEEDLERLRTKAGEIYTGKGFLSHYITKIARSRIIFLDQNVQELIDALKLRPNKDKD